MACPRPRFVRLAAASAVLAFVLAGCSSPAGDGNGTTPGPGGAVPDATTYSITIENFNGRSSPYLAQDDFTRPEVQNGTDFEFTMKVEGSVVLQSDHIGGHFGTTPDPDASAIACDHVAGRLPDTYTITCRAPQEAREYRIRGHARITHNGQQIDWWSQELLFRVT